MAKEQSTRMFNTFDDSTGVLKWVNGAGTTVAMLDLNRIPGPTEDVPTAMAQFRMLSGVSADAMVYGFEVKVSRAAALSIVDGKRPTWDAKSKAMQETIDALYRGSWNAKRDSSGLLYQALQRLAERGSMKAAEYVAEWVGTDDETKKRLAKSETVRRVCDEIRAERAGDAPDDLIDDL